MKLSRSWLLLLVCWTSCSKSAPTPPRDETAEAAARIDAALESAMRWHVEQRQKVGVKEAAVPAIPPMADDATFLRRACVDLAGRLPRVEEARAFGVDTTPDKRARLIDRLLQERGAGEWRFQQMADALRVKDSVQGVSQETYIAWLRAAFQEDRPLGQVMGTLVSATGTLAENPASGFLLRDYGCAEATAGEVAGVFLGMDIRCASCHDHPFGDSTQRQYHEFAASFARTRERGASSVDKARIAALFPPHVTRLRPDSPFPIQPGLWQVLDRLNPPEAEAAFKRLELASGSVGHALPARYLYRDGKSGQPVKAKSLPLRYASREVPAMAEGAGPEALAAWLTGPQNKRFSATVALRLWSQMFGLTPAAPGQKNAWREGNQGFLPSPQQRLAANACGEAPVGTRRYTATFEGWLERDDSGFIEVLRQEFDRCGQRVGEFQRVLAHTRAYQREAVTGAPESVFFVDFSPLLPAPQVRRLPPEVVWDALATRLPATAAATTPDWRPSVALPQVLDAAHPLRVLGRGSREWADESLPVVNHAVARLMIAHPVVEAAIAADSPLVMQALDAQGGAGALEHLFLALLGREPAPQERAAVTASDLQGQNSLPHVAWALVNTREFLFQH